MLSRGLISTIPSGWSFTDCNALKVSLWKTSGLYIKNLSLQSKNPTHPQLSPHFPTYYTMTKLSNGTYRPHSWSPALAHSLLVASHHMSADCRLQYHSALQTAASLCSWWHSEVQIPAGPAQLVYKKRPQGGDFRELQILWEQQGRSDPLTSSAMLSAVLLLGLAAATCGAPDGGHLQYEYKLDNCHTKYIIKVERQCHQEYDTVVETTYVKECKDVVTRHCSKVRTKVYGKREAEAEPGFRGHFRPVCQRRVERQCRKVPRQEARQVARQVCVPVEVKVPHQVCASSHVARHGQGYRH